MGNAKKEKTEDPEKSSNAKANKKSLSPDAVKDAEDEEEEEKDSKEEEKDDKEEDKDGKEEDKDGKEEPEPSAEGKIKTHEVDSVIDKMNMLNEMFEMILKHMDKVIPVHGHDEKDSSGKDETKPEGDDDDEKKEEKTEGDDEESTDDKENESEEGEDEDYS